MVAERAKVYMVGAGPGDPDLLTRKAARILAQAEVVIFDNLVSPEILSLANPNARFVHARKQRGQQEEVQAEIYAWYLRLREAGGPVVRLKSGDPMVFGRGAEELEFLTRHGFDVEVVPGVSAVTAVPGAAKPVSGYKPAAGSNLSSNLSRILCSARSAVFATGSKPITFKPFRTQSETSRESAAAGAPIGRHGTATPPICAARGPTDAMSSCNRAAETHWVMPSLNCSSTTSSGSTSTSICVCTSLALRERSGTSR